MVAIHSEISCRRVPAALNIFIFSRLLLYTADAAHIHTPHTFTQD